APATARSVPTASVPPDYADHDALYHHTVRWEVHRLHALVRRLQPDLSIAFAVEPLHRGRLALHQSDHHLAILRSVARIDDDVVAIPDLLLDHRVAAHPQDVVIAATTQHVLRYRHCLRISDRLDRLACR